MSNFKQKVEPNDCLWDISLIGQYGSGQI